MNAQDELIRRAMYHLHRNGYALGGKPGESAGAQAEANRSTGNFGSSSSGSVNDGGFHAGSVGGVGGNTGNGGGNYGNANMGSNGSASMGGSNRNLGSAVDHPGGFAAAGPSAGPTSAAAGMTRPGELAGTVGDLVRGYTSTGASALQNTAPMAGFNVPDTAFNNAMSVISSMSPVSRPSFSTLTGTSPQISQQAALALNTPEKFNAVDARLGFDALSAPNSLANYVGSSRMPVGPMSFPTSTARTDPLGDIMGKVPAGMPGQFISHMLTPNPAASMYANPAPEYYSAPRKTIDDRLIEGPTTSVAPDYTPAPSMPNPAPEYYSAPHKVYTESLLGSTSPAPAPQYTPAAAATPVAASIMHPRSAPVPSSFGMPDFSTMAAYAANPVLGAMMSLYKMDQARINNMTPEQRAAYQAQTAITAAHNQAARDAHEGNNREYDPYFHRRRQQEEQQAAGDVPVATMASGGPAMAENNKVTTTPKKSTPSAALGSEYLNLLPALPAYQPINYMTGSGAAPAPSPAYSSFNTFAQQQVPQMMPPTYPTPSGLTDYASGGMGNNAVANAMRMLRMRQLFEQ